MSAAAPPLPLDNRRSVLGAVSALSVVLIWATWLVSTRHSVTAGLGPLDLSLLRYGIPALVLTPVWWRTGLFPKGASGAVFLMILGSGAPFFQLVFFGMRHTPASAAGVLLPGLMPLAVALIGMIFLGERPDIWCKLGMAAIFAGGALLLCGNLGDDGLSWVSFTILPFGAVLWAVYTHAFRRSGLTAFEGAALICVWSTILNLAALPFVGTQFFTAPAGEIALQSLTQGILSGLVSTLLYGSAVRALGGTQAAAYTAITPVAAALGGTFLLGEPLGLATLMAALITGIGVLLSTGVLGKR